MKRRSLALGFLVTALSGAVVTAAPGSTTVTYRSAIYEIRDDGKQRRVIGPPNLPVQRLISSRDGRSILYSMETDGEWALFAAETSGANPVRLSPPGIPVSNTPDGAFSPDGRTIAFSSHIVCGFRCAGHSLYLVNRDGSGFRLLAEDAAQPSWALDSRRLAYTGRGGISVIDIASNVSKLIGSGYRPIWAPRGQRIAFNATRGAYGVACFVNADGSRLRCTRGHSLGSLVWSRDAKRVAFRQKTPPRLGIVDSDARHIRYLGNHGQSARPATWSPDGKRLAYLFNAYGFTLNVLRLEKPRQPVRLVHEENAFLSDLHWRRNRITYVATTFELP